MGVTLPAEMQGATVQSSAPVGVQQKGENGYKPIVPAVQTPGAKVESLAMLLASGAGGIGAADATAGIEAMNTRAQGGHHPLTAQIGQQLQGMGLNPVEVAHNNPAPSSVPAPQKGPLGIA
jgi:hypothetical protein